MTSAFQAVAKCHAPISPGVLFELRSWGLRCLVRSSSLKADPFWDQAGKYSASYVKVSGNVVRDAVVGLLDTLFELAAAREDGDAFLRGRGFISICEYRLKFARAVSSTSLSSDDPTPLISRLCGSRGTLVISIVLSACSNEVLAQQVLIAG